MVRPLGRPLARRAVTLDDLREEFLAHLRGPQPEPPGPWSGTRTASGGLPTGAWTEKSPEPSDLRWSDLQAFVLDRRRRGFADNTVHGYAQVVKTLCQLGHRMTRRQTGGFESRQGHDPYGSRTFWAVTNSRSPSGQDDLRSTSPLRDDQVRS